jgi:hypothetical protein
VVLATGPTRTGGGYVEAIANGVVHGQPLSAVARRLRRPLEPGSGTHDWAADGDALAARATAVFAAPSVLTAAEWYPVS